MPVKRYTLDGRVIRSLDDLYEQLACTLSFPRHFGRNLDALWDVLATDVQGPFEIVWKHADASKKLMVGGFDQTVKLLQALEKERDDFRLTIEP